MFKTASSGYSVGRSAAWMLLVVAAVPMSGQAATNPPIRSVRVGFGNLEGLRNSITLSNDACRVMKHLPPQPVTLPSDSALARFEVVEVEELFDGQHYAKYETQRQIGADGSSGCALVVFAQRSAIAELTCASRIQGETSLLQEIMDFEQPSTAPPTISEEVVTPSTCREKPRVLDLAGLSRVDIRGTRCVWNGDLSARQMARITGTPPEPAKGFDICLYEAVPTYYYEGFGRPVIVMSEVRGAPASGSVLERTIGETAAPGNLKSKSFSATESIALARFQRSSVEAFVNQPAKSSL